MNDESPKKARLIPSATAVLAVAAYLSIAYAVSYYLAIPAGVGAVGFLLWLDLYTDGLMQGFNR